MNNLFVNLYNSPRLGEMIECLAKNTEVFDKIYVIGDVKSTFPKSVNIPFSGRPTFKDYFAFVNKYTSKKDYNVIANSDIYFEEPLSSLWNIKEDEVIALTRWEGRVFFGRSCSQDAWIFKGRIKDVPGCSFYLGLRGSDNAIAERLEMAGYKISNYSLDIRIQHLHFARTASNEYAPRPYKMSVPLNGDAIGSFTTINPNDRIKEQAEAIDKWFAPVFSVNTKEEIAKLSNMKEFDGVIFLEAKSTRGKYVTLDSMLWAMRESGIEVCCLINSDIHIDGVSLFNNIDFDRAIIGARIDIDPNTERKSLFPHGYDMFILPRKLLSVINPSEYAIGLPFWDFYVPLCLIKAVRPIIVRGLCFHIKHETRYNERIWNSLAQYSRGRSEFKYRDYIQLGDFTTLNKNFIEQNCDHEDLYLL